MTPLQSAQERHLLVLETQCPLSTDSERQRFLKSCNGNTEKAAKRLRKYLHWRAQHVKDIAEKQQESSEENDDEADWKWAVCAALEFLDLDEKNGKRGNKRKSPRSQTNSIPQIVMLHTDQETGLPVTECDGRLLFHVLPAQIDQKLTSSGIYELTIALYLESKLDRECLQQGTLLFDVRPGVGFANPPALLLMPFIKSISKYLNQRFPERLYRCILYPLPRPALWLWHIASGLLDDNVVDRIKLVAGEATIDAPPPNEDLAEYIDESVLEQVESARLAAFVNK